MAAFWLALVADITTPVTANFYALEPRFEARRGGRSCGPAQRPPTRRLSSLRGRAVRREGNIVGGVPEFMPYLHRDQPTLCPYRHRPCSGEGLAGLRSDRDDRRRSTPGSQLWVSHIGWQYDSAFSLTENRRAHGFRLPTGGDTDRIHAGDFVPTTISAFRGRISVS